MAFLSNIEDVVRNYAMPKLGAVTPQPTAPTGMATNQMYSSTPAVASAPAASTNPWKDVGLNIEGGGNMAAPIFSQNDWEWYGGDNIADRTYNAGGNGDSGPSMVNNPNWRGAGWYMSDAAKNRLGHWATDNSSSISWMGANPLKTALNADDDQFWDGRFGSTFGDGSYSPGTFNQERYNQAAEQLKANNPYLKGDFSAKVKSADKKGTWVHWNGLDNPMLGGSEEWDTNNGAMNRKALLAFTALIGGGLAAGGLLGAAGAGVGAGEAAAGAAAGAGGIGSTVGSGTLAELMAGGLGASGGTLGGGITAGGAGLGGLSATGAAGTLGGTFGGLANIGAATGAVGGTLGGLAGSGGAGMGTGLGSMWDTAKTGYDYYNKAKKGLNLFNQLTADAPQQRRRMTPPMNGTQNGVYSNGMPGEGGGFDWQNMLFGGGGNGGTGLMDLWGAFEGSRQMKDLSGNMKGLYEQELAKRDQPLNMLNQSYNNPDVFYNSSQWKGLSDVYKNNVDRMAGKGGTLANPTQREQLLNNYALKELENWRQGLRQQAGVYKPSIEAITRGYEAESRANNPYGALGGRGSIGGPGMQGGTGGIEQLIRRAMGGGGGYGNNPSMGSLDDIIRQVGGQGPGGVGMGGWSSGGDVGMPSYNPFTGANEPVFGGDTWGDGLPQWGGPQLDPGYYGSIPGMDYGNAFSGGGGYDIGNFDFGSAPVEDIGDFLGGFLEW